MSSAAFKKELAALQAHIQAARKDQNQNRLSRLKGGKGSEAVAAYLLKDVPPSADMEALWGDMRRRVVFDMQRYTPGDPLSEDAVPPALPPASPLVAATREAWKVLMERPVMADETAHLSPPERFFLHLLAGEIDTLTDVPTMAGRSGGPLQGRLQKVMLAFLSGREGDALILLKTLLKQDPHSHMLAFLLSQFSYMLAMAKQQNTLPEARDMAQKCMIASEKVPPAKLAFYQYHTLVTERALGDERVMEWLRETRLLDPAVLTSREGLMVHGGVHILAWMMLADMPLGLWRQQEFQNLRQLFTEVVGGSAFYFGVLRPRVLEGSSERSAPWPFQTDMEDDLQKAYGFYAEVSHALAQTRVQVPWTVRNRYLLALWKAYPLLPFDQLLLAFSVDGENYQTNTDADANLRALLGDSKASYWRLWAHTVTPVHDRRQAHLIPAMEAAQDAPVYETCDRALLTLKAAEQERIKPAIWNAVRPWMVRWNMEHLLAAGSGSNKPRTHFAPTLPPFTFLYRAWCEPAPTGYLASEMIAENAEKGAFASMFEALAAFEGATRLLDDPQHGLIATQKRALATAKAQRPDQFASLHVDWGSAVTEKAGGLLVPALVMAGCVAAFALGRNWQQSVGILLAVLGLAGIAALGMWGKKQ